MNFCVRVSVKVLFFARHKKSFEMEMVKIIILKQRHEMNRMLMLLIVCKLIY